MLLFEKPKRVLITGGAGFLGSHLIDKVLDHGSHVICVDNLFTGSKNNIAHLDNNPKFEFIRHDISHPLYLEVDQIYNLACPASPMSYQYDPIQTTKTSVLGALNVLGLAKRLSAPIFQASTSEIYGDPFVHPQPESYWGNVNSTGIRSCYDEGKRCAETLFFDYHRQHGLDIKVARIFNTYGPRMDTNDGRVVSNFIMQALQINLGNPFEFTVLELAEKVISLTGSSSKLVSLPLPQDDPTQRQPDIRRAKKMLQGWEPKVMLDEGLVKTISYFESLLQKEIQNV